MEKELEEELKGLAREAIKTQDYDELLIFLSMHETEVPKNVWANGQAVIAFTILDSVWQDADSLFLDYGDEQSDAYLALDRSILGAEEIEKIWEEME